METAEFWMTAPRYLQQVGDAEPKYVHASPGHPVKVVLPAKITRKGEVLDQPDDSHLKRIKKAEAAPAAPVDVRPKVDRPTAKLAPEMTKKVSEDAKK